MIGIWFNDLSRKHFQEKLIRENVEQEKAEHDAVLEKSGLNWICRERANHTNCLTLKQAGQAVTPLNQSITGHGPSLESGKGCMTSCQVASIWPRQYCLPSLSEIGCFLQWRKRHSTSTTVPSTPCITKLYLLLIVRSPRNNFSTIVNIIPGETYKRKVIRRNCSLIAAANSKAETNAHFLHIFPPLYPLLWLSPTSG